MKNILIINQHSDNRGDQAACRAMVRSLERMMPDSYFTIVSYSPQFPLITGENISHLGFNAFSKKNLILSTLWAIFPFLRRALSSSIASENLSILRAYQSADIVISAPGGPYIGDLYSMELRFLYFDWLSSVFNKLWIIYAPSMGPFNKQGRNILRRYVLNKAVCILVRDPISFEHVEKLKLKPPLFLAADSALQENFNDCDLQSLKKRANIPDNVELLVGMTPADLSWHPSRLNTPEDSSILTTEQIALILAKTLDWLWEEYRACTVFFPQLFGRQSDRDIIEKVIAFAEHGHTAKILPFEMDSDDQQCLARAMDLFIGMRYHSAIFAAKAYTPVICVAYEHKAVGFMQSVGLGEYVILVDQLSEDRLKTLVKKCLSESAVITDHLRITMPDLESKALLSSRVVTDILTAFGSNRNMLRRTLVEKYH
ncbi:MAG TPA: polysaccharide pyruvyl transferase family protein [Anaerolineae bacterium]|nr:polysaccharide pyruvyl transferase family protein [Anaerolineae bacterium]HQK12348.1 polysaccharide pyruvyl transferase family protein [Anaerolineae bacterium]